MHIVVVSQVFHPDTQSTSQLFSDLFRGMKYEDLRITVVTGYTASDNGVALRQKENFGPVEIRRTGVALNYKRNLLLRGLHYFCYVAGSTFQLWKLRKCSVIFGVTNPPFTPVWLWFLSKVFATRYQLMLLDIYPDGLNAIGALNRDGLLTRLWRAANRKAFLAADCILVLGRDMQTLLEDSYSVPPHKITYVPHWGVLSAQEPITLQKSRLYRELRLEGKFVVQYSGNMGLWHDIDIIIEAAARLKHRRDVHFLMIGDGRRRAAALRRANELDLQNITWLPFQPKDTLRDSLSCCDIALISQRPALTGVAVPCKLYGILGSARPVLAIVPEGCEIDLVVREECCGRTVTPGDADELANVIVEMEANRGLLNQMAQNAISAFRDNYTVEIARQRFARIWGLINQYEPQLSDMAYPRT